MAIRGSYEAALRTGVTTALDANKRGSQQGRIQDFQIEGAQKIMRSAHYYEHEARSPLQPGSIIRRARIEALEAYDCRWSLMLSEHYFEEF